MLHFLTSNIYHTGESASILRRFEQNTKSREAVCSFHNVKIIFCSKLETVDRQPLSILEYLM